MKNHLLFVGAKGGAVGSNKPDEKVSIGLSIED